MVEKAWKGIEGHQKDMLSLDKFGGCKTSKIKNRKLGKAGAKK